MEYVYYIPSLNWLYVSDFKDLALIANPKTFKTYEVIYLGVL